MMQLHDLPQHEQASLASRLLCLLAAARRSLREGYARAVYRFFDCVMSLVLTARGEARFSPTHSAGVVVGAQREWVEAAAGSIETNGFTTLLGQPLDPSLCARVAETAATELDATLALAGTHVGDVQDSCAQFREVCTRAPGSRRFDINWSAVLARVPHGEVNPHAATLPAAVAANVAELACALDALVQPVLQRWAARDAAEDDGESDGGGGDGGGGVPPPAVPHMAGCIDSLPGSPDQHWHLDGPQRGLFTVYVALADVTAANGPTELRPGSHRQERLRACGVELRRHRRLPGPTHRCRSRSHGPPALAASA